MVIVTATDQSMTTSEATATQSSTLPYYTDSSSTEALPGSVSTAGNTLYEVIQMTINTM